MLQEGIFYGMMRENGALPHVAGMEAVVSFLAPGGRWRRWGTWLPPLGSLLSYLSCWSCCLGPQNASLVEFWPSRRCRSLAEAAYLEPRCVLLVGRFAGNWVCRSCPASAFLKTREISEIMGKLTNQKLWEEKRCLSREKILLRFTLMKHFGGKGSLSREPGQKSFESKWQTETHSE